jgi:hypothetical protein
MIDVRPAAWSQAALDALAPAFAADPFGGLATPLQAVAGCYLIELHSDGRPFALLAVEPRALAGGTELQIVAGVRTAPGGVPMPAALRELEQWATGNGAAVLSMLTGKPAVARLARAAGWPETGRVFAKRLQGVH